MSSTHASAHFSSVDQTHADLVLPKLQATATTHLSILFAVIEFFFFFFFNMYLHMGLVAVVVVVDFGYGSGGG